MLYKHVRSLGCRSMEPIPLQDLPGRDGMGAAALALDNDWQSLNMSDIRMADPPTALHLALGDEICDLAIADISDAATGPIEEIAHLADDATEPVGEIPPSASASDAIVTGDPAKDQADGGKDFVALACCLQIWATCTDAGSDEAMARRLRHIYSKDCLHSWLFDMDCLCHQFHLLVCGVLRDMDWLIAEVFAESDETMPKKFWTALATLFHVMRDLHVSLIEQWVEAGGVRARGHDLFTQRVPPKPHAGRWGTVIDMIKYLTAIDTDCLRTAFDRTQQKMAAKGDKKRKRDDGQQQTSTVDELGLDETKAHVEKMGRWRQIAFNIIHSEPFFILCHAFQILVEPLGHFYNAIRQKIGLGEPLNLACLVWGKAMEIRKEISDLFVHGAWPVLLGRLEEKLGHETKQKFESFVFLCIHRVQSAYQRRILDRLQNPLVQSLWIGYRMPHEECLERLRYAKTVLETDDASLHVTVRKIKTVMRRELEHIVATNGCCTMVVYTAFRLLSMWWRADVQEIEGLNSIIKWILRNSPSISLALLDARVANSKSLGLGSKDAAKLRNKWSNVAPAVNALVDEAEANLGGANGASSVLTQAKRWRSPQIAIAPAVDYQTTSAALLDVGSTPREALEWARSYSNHWFSTAKNGHGVLGSLLFFDDAPEEAWLCVEKFKHTGRFYKCIVHVETKSVVMQKHGESMESFVLFAQRYQRCRGTGNVPVRYQYTDIAGSDASLEDGSWAAPLVSDKVHLFALQDKPLKPAKATPGAKASQPAIVDATCDDDEAPTLLQLLDDADDAIAGTAEALAFTTGDAKHEDRLGTLDLKRTGRMIATAGSNDSIDDLLHLELGLDSRTEDHSEEIDRILDTHRRQSISRHVSPGGVVADRPVEFAECVHRLGARWHDGATGAVLALSHRHRVAELGVPRFQRLSMSLVCRREGGAEIVQLVAWHEAATGIGWPIAIHNGIPSYPMSRPICLRPYGILHADVGIPLIKPKDLRVSLPDEVLRLKAMIDVSLQKSDEKSARDASAFACYLCGQRTLSGGAHAIQCSCCLMVCHSACCQRMVDATRKTIPLPPTDAIGNVPLQLTSRVVCVACRRIIEPY